MREAKLIKLTVAADTRQLVGVTLNRLRDEANEHAAQALALERSNQTAEAAEANALAVRATWCCETMMYVMRVYNRKETPTAFTDALERFESGLKQLAAAHRCVEEDVRARGR
jgi:hypothetical protein